MHPETIKLEHYNIYNMSGLDVLNGEENSVIIASLSQGVYIINMKFNQGVVSKKFVKY